MSQNNTKAPRPLVLCILDGWGEREERSENAIALAETPNWDRLKASCPTARLNASASAVGLPEGQMGNSEVGHMNLGAGRVVMQDLPRIEAAIADGGFSTNPELAEFVDRLAASGGRCHMMGLLSPGGVHSLQDHMTVLARHVAGAGVPVAVHAFLDGRDTPPSSGLGYMRDFLASVADQPGTKVATVGGRYYAMDRDKRWDRVEKAYDSLVMGEGETAAEPVAAIEASYAAGVTDEFMLPTVIGDYRGMADGDGVLMANFRADRAREILGALADPDFTGFAPTRRVALAARLGLVEYSDDLNRLFGAMFPSLKLENVLGQVVAEAGRTQLRIAETEKYAHVTFFLNGGREMMFPGEERILVPSPKVATYDLKPEMSAFEVTDKLVAAIESGGFDLIVVNYANGDMVGHTGILEAAIGAVGAVDVCLGRIEEAVRKAAGVLLITADHGNAELMRDPDTDVPHTAHTLNPVPIILVDGRSEAASLGDGCLADVAPTVLQIMGLPQPTDMTGQSLLDVGGARSVAAS